MSKIKVHLLNFHGVASHLEIVLENTSIEPHTFYKINRWDEAPKDNWDYHAGDRISEASSIYTFDIDADQNEITSKWKNYWNETNRSASYAGDNCAVAVQWFLSKFAAIPEPNSSNFSFNHVLLGTIWPSFIPCPVTLPGRVMSNAQFYLDARTHPVIANHYSTLFLKACFSASLIAFTTSVKLANPTSSKELVPLGIVAGISSLVFFKSYNLLTKTKIAHRMNVLKDDLGEQRNSKPT